MREGIKMLAVNIRELTHNFSKYLKEVKAGECITIMDRKSPVADIIPHNKNITFPGWKRTIERRKVKGESLSESVVKNRETE